jgi:hypothetical protein
MVLVSFTNALFVKAVGFAPKPTAFSRAVLLDKGRPTSAHTHNDAISREGIPGCPL